MTSRRIVRVPGCEQRIICHYVESVQSMGFHLLFWPPRDWLEDYTDTWTQKENILSCWVSISTWEPVKYSNTALHFDFAYYVMLNAFMLLIMPWCHGKFIPATCFSLKEEISRNLEYFACDLLSWNRFKTSRKMSLIQSFWKSDVIKRNFVTFFVNNINFSQSWINKVYWVRTYFLENGSNLWHSSGRRLAPPRQFGSL